eukprot:TRINITY_DN10664_c0_g1_i1.p1 TRINITY_DN10664_c0_g1~~TRINITY_DN10664_c0_g1_i1.p1  ORF type:complete len:324 (+),score=59.24 TRINITY_DN10664_c0_g1_i1:84-1055(+)
MPPLRGTQRQGEPKRSVAGTIPFVPNWKYEWPNRTPDARPEPCPDYSADAPSCSRGLRCPLMHVQDDLGDSRPVFLPSWSLIPTELQEGWALARRDRGIRKWHQYIEFAGWTAPPQLDGWDAEEEEADWQAIAAEGVDQHDVSEPGGSPSVEPPPRESDQGISPPSSEGPSEVVTRAFRTARHKELRIWPCGYCSFLTECEYEKCGNCRRRHPSPPPSSPPPEHGTEADKCSVCSYKDPDPRAETCSVCGHDLRQVPVAWQPPAAAARTEHRIDPRDGQPYTKEQFFAEYEGYSEWEKAAPVPVAAPGDDAAQAAPTEPAAQE